MNRIIGIFTLSVATVFFAVSCLSLDTPPYDRETDLTYWDEDPNAALYALNTCYTGIASIDELMLSETMTDNAYMSRTSGYTQAIGNGSFSTADDYVELVWDSKYAGIRQCNELLANIDRVPGLEESLKKRYIGEAKVIRAHHYYELYTKFGDVPYIDYVISIEESQVISRTDRAVVVSNIISDLDEVISGEYLPTSYGDADKGRMTIWAAKALKAKVNLFEGNWKEVRDITSDIMRNGGFVLFPDYSGLFEAANEYNSEIIMDIEYMPNSRENNFQYNFLPPSLGGYAILCPLQSLVDSYIMINGKRIKEDGSGYDEADPFKDRDPRLKATIIYTGNSYIKADGTEAVIDCKEGGDGYNMQADATKTGYYVRKYWDKTYRSNLLSGLNPIVIRYADILLMNAEAKAELGELDEQSWNATIKQIRERAGFPKDGPAVTYPSNLSKDELIEVVRQERRSELAMEGHRYKDIIRWKIAEDVMNGWCHGFRTEAVVGADDGYIRIEQRQFDPVKHYLWPIPQAERDLNKNLSQNPNW